MRKFACFSLLLFATLPAAAQIFSRVQGIVHDPQHRPLPNAQVTLKAAHSQFTRTVSSDRNGDFLLPAVPKGVYLVTASAPGFSPLTQALTLTSLTSPVLHFELPIAAAHESVTVTSHTATDVDSVTPTTVVTRGEIANTPGANLTNSLKMITSYVPGAYVTHDMLHIRGGHQVTWQIDGVEIPNTNIASNLGAQIDPKDIDFLETERGSYNANIGDRTYGVFNVVPRNGFERDREAELLLSAGSFLSTDDQLSLGNHTEKFAWYASLTGNRSDFGLAPPVESVHHDAANGVGAFTSLLFNRTSKDQLRLVAQARKDFFQIPYDPDANSPENQQYDSSGLRDAQHESDVLAAFTWAHTAADNVVLQLSPFFHFNRANYQPNPDDLPVATTSDRTSNYAGLQASLTGEIARNTLQAGLYSFGQHDSSTFGSVFNDASAPNFLAQDSTSGGLIEEYLSYTFKATPWLTFIGGLRQSHFTGAFAENASSPRIGIALQIPRLDWVFRAFYGRFYQPPPLLSVSGPVAQYATTQSTGFVPLHGERDEEHQFGVQIPLRGWLLDADTFQTRARNFLDHSNLGESSIYYPVSVDGALIQGWELTLASPAGWRFGHAHLAYSNQIAKQRGALTGGLVCVPIGSPACDADFTYTPVDHDQRNTLSLAYNATLPGQFHASADLSYGSGFHNGSPNSQYPGEYLPQHASVDLALSHSLRENTILSVNALNVTNHRVLLDNSLTFGGFHYNNPRQIYADLRFRFHF